MAETAQKLYIEFEARLESLRAAATQGDGIIEDFDKKVDSTLNRLDQRFSKFGEDSLSNIAARVRSNFRASLNEIEQAAANAGSGGGASVNSGGAQAAAAAARAQANATREIADAALRAASAEGQLTTETQAYLRAANLAAANAEANATNLERQAGWLQRVDMELRAATGAHNQLVPAQRRATVSAGQMRAGMQQMGYQIGDVTTSLSTLPLSLQSAAVVFAQQSSQMVQAVSLMTNETKGFIGFMAGPWGTVMNSALIVLAMVSAAYLDGSDAQKEQTNSAKELENAIKSLDDAAKRNIETSFQAEARSYALAQSFRDQARETRELTIEKLKLAQADLQSRLASSRGPGTTGSDLQAIGAGRVAGDIEKLNALIAEQTSELEKREDTVRRTKVPLVQRGIAAALDKSAAATWRYDQALARLNASLDTGKISDRQYAAEVGKVTRARDAELDAIQKSAAAQKKTESEARKASTKAAREHAAALKEIQRELEGLVNKYDPAARAADDLAQALARIDQFQKLGNISVGDALLYKIKAGREYVEQMQAAAKADFKAVLGWEPGSADDPFVRMANDAPKAADKLAREYSEKLLSDPTTSKAYKKAMETIGTDTQTHTVRIAESWKDAAQSVNNSLNQLANDISNGGLLDILSSVINLMTQLGSMGAFGSGIQASLNTSVRGHRDGGLIAMADGGRVIGPGGPRTDNLLRLLSPGEYVVNAAATKGWLPFLDAINYGRLPAMADGGAVGRIPRPSLSGLMRDARDAQQRQAVVYVQVETNDYLDVKMRSTSAEVAAPMATSAALTGADLATRRAARSRRNRIPGR